MTNLPARRPARRAVIEQRSQDPAHPQAPALSDLSDLLDDDQLEQLSPALRRTLTSARDKAAGSRAGSTRYKYGKRWDRFVEWVNDPATGLPPQLMQAKPAHPGVVALYAAHLADTGGHDGNGRRPGTIGNYLTAIRSVHVDSGLSDPTAHPDVRRVLSGIKREKGTRPQPREPMVYAELCRVIFALDVRHDLRAVRDRVLLAAQTTSVAGQYATDPERAEPLSTSQLAGASWEGVSVLDEDRVVLAVPSPSNRSTTVEVEIPARPDDELCFVAALHAQRDLLIVLLDEVARGLVDGEFADRVAGTWAADRRGNGAGLAGPMLPSLDRRGRPKPGEHPTRQQLDGRLKRAAHDAGLTPTRTTTPTWTDAGLRAALAETQQRPLIDLRDRALLLNGFHLAARGSNLTWLRLGEVFTHKMGLEFLFRRSKTDQEGAGRMLAVARNPRHPRYCPVTAWNEWAAALRAARPDAGPEFPAFPPITKDGSAIDDPEEMFEVGADGQPRRDTSGALVSLGLQGVTRQQVNTLVKQRAKEAGLNEDEHGQPRPWGSHSLRRGWLTEGARQGISLEKLMAHSGHVSHESVLLYIQEANRWDPAQSAPLAMKFDVASAVADAA